MNRRNLESGGIALGASALIDHPHRLAFRARDLARSLRGHGAGDADDRLDVVADIGGPGSARLGI